MIWHRANRNAMRCDAMRVAASQIIRSLNVSASNNLRSAKLFVAPPSQVPANIAFLVFLVFIFERPIQILFRIHLVSVIKCYLSHPR